MSNSIFATDMQNPEGPVSLPDGSWLVTEMDAAAITHLSADGKSRRVVAHTGLPNGLAVDRNGDIWVADARWRALLRVTMDGHVSTVSTGSAPDPFLLPNDLCFGPDGMIYMTDSGIELDSFRQLDDPADTYNLAFDGRVYRIDPNTGESTVLDRGLRLTNGIAFGPGGSELYVAETMTGRIYRYSVGEWQRQLFGVVTVKPPEEFGRVAGPDGIAFDAQGNLFSAVLVQGDLTVQDRDGQVIQRIPLAGNLPTNLAFDCRGQRRLLVTEASRGELLFIETDHPGLPLFT